MENLLTIKLQLSFLDFFRSLSDVIASSFVQRNGQTPGSVPNPPITSSVEVEHDLDSSLGDPSEVKPSNHNKQALPRFPKKPDSMLHQDQVEQRRQQLERYLQAVLSNELYRNHPEAVRWMQSQFNPLS